jgi:hypothetical protein
MLAGPEAALAARDEFERERRIRGPDHHGTQRALRDLTQALAMEERYPEAISLMQNEIARQRRAFGSGHLVPLWLADDLADYLRFQNRYAEAETTLRQQITTVQLAMGEGALPRWHYELASVEAALGEKDQAFTSLKTAFDLGYIDLAAGLAVDHNFSRLRGDRRFAALEEEDRRNREAWKRYQTAKNGR